MQDLHSGKVLSQREFGWRAHRLSRLAHMGLPVPRSLVVPISRTPSFSSVDSVRLKGLASYFAPDSLVMIRSSPEEESWGGPVAIGRLGLNKASLRRLRGLLGQRNADLAYVRFISEYSRVVDRLETDVLDEILHRPEDASLKLDATLQAYRDATGAAFPQESEAQVRAAVLAMVKAWEEPTARILRSSRNAPVDAGLGLMFQDMPEYRTADPCFALALQSGPTSTGVLSTVAVQLPVDHASHCADDRLSGIKIDRAASFDRIKPIDPETRAAIDNAMTRIRRAFEDAVQIRVAVAGKIFWILDVRPAERTATAAIRIAVDLAQDGVISRESALLRIEPDVLGRILHPQVKPSSKNRIYSRGVPSSPGAVSGAIAFSSSRAEDMAAAALPCILVRPETGPEDIRGIYSAKGVLTGRGGITSHAAVIARGLGVPCVTGATGVKFDAATGTICNEDGVCLHEGDQITVDGTEGVVLEGRATLVQPSADRTFRQFLGWADDARDIGIRANADTTEEACLAVEFGADGVGLCRTEHMFFDEERLTAVREMIFARTTSGRSHVLKQLLPVQRDDFIELFQFMQGRPVCIRLFDPPLHEFLPKGQDELQELADALKQPVEDVAERANELREFNPMLGMRGVRLGITIPEIYDMQSRAIFEATVHCLKRGHYVEAEIMIPFVSANREVEIIKERMARVAARVEKELGQKIRYRVGVMVETPRAALRAGDLAQCSDFLSFGTNDLTQMTYGLSRDDAGSFMSEYIESGAFPGDPFQTLDLDGVGELLEIAARRGRRVSREITLSICGEHSGDAEAIAFSRQAGFSYVSCSPYRVPIAKLAAAQCAVRSWNRPTSRG